MNAEGQLKDIDFIDLLVRLWREQFTGAVRAESDALIKIIYFRAGDLLSASTNDRVDSLGEILLRSGKIGREHLKQGMARRKEEESLGDALLGLGFITRRELTWARRTQLVGAIRSVLEWKNGDYNVIQDYVPRRDEGPPFVFPQVLLEVILTRTDREKVDRELELGSLVLERRGDFDELYPQLNLNEEADSIVKLIDGRRSAVRIAVGSDADRFNVYKLLLALKRLGLIGIVGEVEGGERSVESPPMEEAPFLVSEPTFEDDWALADELAVTTDPSSSEPPPIAETSEAPIAEMTAEEPEPTPLAAQLDSSSPSGRHWRIGLLLLASIAVLAATVYFIRVFKPLGSGKLLTEQVGATPAGKAARPAPTPAPIVIEATPTPLSALVSVPSPPSFPTPVAAVPTITPTPTARPRPSPSPAPTPEQIIIARLSRTTPSPPSEPLALQTDPGRARLDAMAEQYAANSSARFAVQFGIFCRTESIEKAMQAGAESVWFVPAIFRGQRCYRAYWGRYEERAAAEAALSELPAALREGTRPTVVQLAR